MAKVNPYCPVSGCKTDRPHTNDPLVREMVAFSNTPQVYLYWVQNTLLELRDSMVDDRKNGRRISWLSRIRLVEELYYRTLYLLFVATPDEAPHILSGDPPNSISIIYDRVNDELLHGIGKLKQGAGPLGHSPLEWLHIGAHGAYPILFALEFDKETEPGLDDYLKEYLDVYVALIQKIGILIVVDGETIQQVKGKVIDMLSKA